MVMWTKMQMGRKLRGSGAGFVVAAGGVYIGNGAATQTISGVKDKFVRPVTPRLLMIEWIDPNSGQRMMDALMVPSEDYGVPAWGAGYFVVNNIGPFNTNGIQYTYRVFGYV